MMTPTLVTSCTSLPPEGGFCRLGAARRRKMTPTLVTSCTSLPPEGAFVALGRPGGAS